MDSKNFIKTGVLRTITRRNGKILEFICNIRSDNRFAVGEIVYVDKASGQLNELIRM